MKLIFFLLFFIFLLHVSNCQASCVQPNRTENDVPKYAYVMLLGDVSKLNNRDYLIAALILAQNLRDIGTKADILAMIYGKTSQADLDLVQQMGIKTVQINSVGKTVTNDPGPFSPRTGEIYRAKLRALQLVEYSRIIFVDLDSIFIKNPDKLFELSAFTSLKAINSPMSAGLIVMTPSCKDFDDLNTIALSDEFTPEEGWKRYGSFPHWEIEGQTSDWTFYGSQVEQGLFWYYYGLVKQTGVFLPRESWDDFWVHFLGSKKPWMADPTKFYLLPKRYQEPTILWYEYYHKVTSEIRRISILNKVRMPDLTITGETYLNYGYQDHNNKNFDAYADPYDPYYEVTRHQNVRRNVDAFDPYDEEDIKRSQNIRRAQSYKKGLRKPVSNQPKERKCQKCQVSTWTPWSDCSVKCGGGHRYRTRTIIEPPNCGHKCHLPLMQNRSCGTHDCLSFLCLHSACVCFNFIDKVNLPTVQDLPPPNPQSGCSAHESISIQPSWNLHPICDKHQVCYGTCNSDKFKCDQELLDSMMESCQRYGQPESGCIDAAKLLHEKMTSPAISNEVFNQSQRNYCTCPTPQTVQIEWEQYVKRTFGSFLDQYCKNALLSFKSDEECRRKGLDIIVKRYFSQHTATNKMESLRVPLNSPDQL